VGGRKRKIGITVEGSGGEVEEGMREEVIEERVAI
jgi:hypothetical protein